MEGTRRTHPTWQHFNNMSDGGERRLAHPCGGLRTGVLWWGGVVCWGRIEQVYRCMGEGADMYAVWGMWLPQVHVGWRRGSCIVGGAGVISAGL